MDIKQLEYFLELVKHENISGTADLLNISQSALSKSIAKLEAEVGIRLFNRYGNHITLNSYGRNFAVYAARSLKVLENGLFSVRQAIYDVNGQLRIVCHAFSGIIAPVVTEYCFLNPRVKINVSRHAEKATSPTDDEDFMLCSGTESVSFLEKSDSWVGQELFREESMILISKRYREYPDTCDCLPLTELKEDKFIGMMESSPLFSDATFRLCTAAGFVPIVSYETNDYLFKVNLIGEGRAIAILPACCVKTAQALYPDIQAFHIQGMYTSRSVFLLRRKKLLMSEAALDFWEFALDYFHSDAGFSPKTPASDR